MQLLRSPDTALVSRVKGPLTRRGERASHHGVRFMSFSTSPFLAHFPHDFHPGQSNLCTVHARHLCASVGFPRRRKDAWDKWDR